MSAATRPERSARGPVTARRSLALLGGYFLLALVFPFLPLGDRADYLLQIAFFTLVTGILALSWDLLARSGQVSLAHAAFYGLGAYGYALLLKAGVPWGLAMPLSSLLAGLVSLLLGAVTMRLSGIYFAIATLAFTEVVRTLVQNLPEAFAGGATRATAKSGPTFEIRGK